MTRTRPAEERRADLLAAGRELFLAKGVAATSLDDITRAAGVSKGLFYLYFRAKEDLVLALQDQFSLEFAERVQAAAAAAADWPAKLDAFVLTGFGYYRDLHDLHEVLFHHVHHVHHDHANERAEQPGLSPVAQVLADILAAGKAAGAFGVEDPALTAVLCYASMHAFDPDFHGAAGDESNARLILAAQQLFRRAAIIELRYAYNERRAGPATAPEAQKVP
jgi:TetR/AcrR family transcriptional repressor of nem operon